MVQSNKIFQSVFELVMFDTRAMQAEGLLLDVCHVTLQWHGLQLPRNNVSGSQPMLMAKVKPGNSCWTGCVNVW